MNNGGLFITGVGCPNMCFESEVLQSIPGGINFSFVDWISKNLGYIKLSQCLQEQEEIRKMAQISREAHGSKICFIFRHQHCIHNHLWDIQKAAREVRTWEFFEKVETIRLPSNCEINLEHKKTIPLIKCMDGRSNLAAIRFFKNSLGVDEVKLFTRPGANGLLAKPSQATNQLLDDIINSYNNNIPKVLGISAHYDCRGNPVSESEHINHLLQAADTARDWDKFRTITPIFVNENWEAQTVLP